MNNKQLGRKLLEVEQKLDILMEAYGIQPNAEGASTQEKKLDEFIEKFVELLAEQNKRCDPDLLLEMHSKLDDLNQLFKEILSLKKGEKPDQSLIMRLIHKFV